MAKTIATITGTALVPGVSRNGRWYKPEHVAEAVRVARERLARGERPMVMLTFHGAEDNSREISASLTDMSLNENGGADFAAGFTDTPAGWNIASLADTSDEKPAHLKNVSIRGAWTGTVRKERHPSGRLVETADGVELDGIDFTKNPGVTGAEIKTFAWVKNDANETAETTERVLITESVQEAHVTAITEGLPEGAPARDPKKPYGDVQYADPGYKPDGVKRWPLDTPGRVREAWSGVTHQGGTSGYTPAQLKRIEGKIKAATVKLGATITDENWTIWPAEQIAESAGEMAEAVGASFSVCASNGPVNVSVSSYSVDPADLELILKAAATAAFASLKTLDPDMDADIDVPGADAEDTDGDNRESTADPEGAVTETAPPAPAETGTTQAPPPAAATNSKEGSAMGEPIITEAAQVPAALTSADIARVVSEALDARAAQAAKAARKAGKAEKKAAKKTAAESAKSGTVTESDEDRIAKLIDAKVAERLTAEGVTPVTETEDQKIDRLVQEKVTAAKQSIVESGQGPGRKGLITEHTAATATHGLFKADGSPAKPPHEWTDDEFTAAQDMMADHYMPPAPPRAE